jgi:nucleoside-diphosphate-sugar epimerase
MQARIFLAGATGAIGRRLTPILCKAGYQVFGMTRSKERARVLRASGAEALIVDVFDAAELAKAIASVRPAVVVHQLTDLPKVPQPDLLRASLPRNARIRDEGTRNLIGAAIAAGAKHFVARSIAWALASGPEPHPESDPLDVGAEGDRGITVRGVAALEYQVLNSPPLKGAVLRYGQLYGPGTYSASSAGSMPVHVDAAAHAVLLTICKSATGLFNIAEPNPHILTDKARTELGWDPGYRLPT